MVSIYRLVASNCLNMDILADLAEVISVIVKPGCNVYAVLMPNFIREMI